MSTAISIFVAADRFRREHQALNELLARIRAAFQVGRHVPPAERESARLLDALEDLRDHLGMLFALEESPELIADEDELPPQFSEHYHAISSEHSALFQELCRTIDYSEDAFCHHALADLLDRIEKQFNDFYAHYLAHEARENHLILQAFNVDIGTGD